MKEIIKSMGGLSLTKGTPSEIAAKLYSNMTEQHTDPFKIFVRADCLSKTVEALKKLAKEDTIEQIERGTDEYLGVKLETAEFGTKYDYTNNPVWVDIKAREEAIAKERKEVEAFCKSIKEHTAVVDPETGETTEYWPPIKTSTTSPKLTYPK